MEFAGNIKNDALVEAIATFKANQGEPTFKAVYEEMVKGKYYVPAILDPKPKRDQNGNPLEKPATQLKINFRVINAPNNKHFFPCFTDKVKYDEGTKIDTEAEFIIVTYPELANMVLQAKGTINGFVINPFTDPMQINEDMIASIEKAKKAFDEKKNSPVKNETLEGKVKLRNPKYMPFALIDECRAFFAEHAQVKNAYLQLLEREDRDEEFLVAVDMDCDEKDIFPQLMPLIHDKAYGMPVLLTKADSGLGRQIAERVEPFYTSEEQADA